MYKKVGDLLDAMDIQDDLNRLVEYNKINKLSVNISKCVKIIFTRSCAALKYSYRLGNDIVQTLSEVCDLSIVLDRRYFVWNTCQLNSS